MTRLPVGYSVRLAIVTKVYKTQVECMFTDREGEHNVRCAMPYPYAGSSGGGIFFGIEKNTRVIISMAPQEQAYIVGIIPDRSYYFSQEGLKDSLITSSSYPEVAPGEVCLKSSVGSRIDMFNTGNISFEAKTGNLEADFELSQACEGIFTRTNNTYKFTEAGRKIEGIIKRDVSQTEDPNDTSTINFLSGESYESMLLGIGRKPYNDTSYRTSQISKLTVRNPALVEKRSITYEYASSYGVSNIEKEAKAMLKVEKNTLGESYSNLSTNYSSRENRRADVLDLNQRNFNHLIEKVEGTVVDIYGNILDINRNIINLRDGFDINTSTDSGSIIDLRRLYSYLRRSIKYHFEINSRKSGTAVDPSVMKSAISKNNAKEHSRWSIDIDGEGLTKINIPASSETGNIPVLGRYVVSRNTDPNKRDEGQFKDKDHRDVRMLPFVKGQTTKITDASYIPVIIDVDHNGKDGYQPYIGTAHHDITKIAPSIFSSGKLRNPNPGVGAPSVPPFNTKVNNKILDEDGTNPDANAGGRSLQLNLDGSAEVSIGADTIDRKSIVLDTAGAVVAHYGRDRNGRSIIQQTDGDVIIQIGGKGLDTDERFTDSTDVEDRPGRIEIHLNRPGANSQKIIIDENGITIDISGNGVIQTSGDLTLKAKGSLLLDGETVGIYGNSDTSVDGARNISGAEKLVIRDGRIV